MRTPFEEVIQSIRDKRYHNHRREEHSDLVSQGILEDLLEQCPKIREDYDSGAVQTWFNVPAPGTRGRKIDLFVGEPGADGCASVRGVRICVENKSVITAHRNKTNRVDDLQEVLGAIHREKAEAIIVGTVMVGTATRVLNIPDQVKKHYRRDLRRFEQEVIPRLSTGEAALWQDFEYAVSENRADDPAKTIEVFRSLPTRSPGHTHVFGYDYVLIVPVFIDNVNPPDLCKVNPFDIDISTDYQRMLDTICRAYVARWHL